MNDIVNAQVNASAAIALSKLATGALPSGITVASANLVDGTIVNADINASAAIAESKLAFDTSAGHDHDGTDSKRISGAIINSGTKVTTGNTSITSGTPTTLTGATVTFTPAVAVTVFVSATFGFSTATTGTDQYSCAIDIDGAQPASLVTDQSDKAGGRKFVTVSYVGNLTAASHTISMKMSIVAGSTTATALSNACVFSYIAFAQ